MTKLYKYPRTFHLPWSPGATRDDRILSGTEQFLNQEVVVTEKLDGENTSMYQTHIHARSLSSDNHPSRTWVKGLWGRIRHNIPEGYRICGENLFARHSITYDDLNSYFQAFSIWSKENVCLSFRETIEWCKLLEIEHVPVLYEGIYDESFIRSLWSPQINNRESEGYVIRLRRSFSYNEFGECVGKFVRKSHVQTDSHWMYNEIIPNGLKSS